MKQFIENDVWNDIYQYFTCGTALDAVIIKMVEKVGHVQQLQPWL